VTVQRRAWRLEGRFFFGHLFLWGIEKARFWRKFESLTTTRQTVSRLRFPYNRGASLRRHSPPNKAALFMTSPKDKKKTSSTIALNRKARHDYFIEADYECGLALEGWEVKSLRAGKAQLTESYVNLRDGEAWLLGAHITPLSTASTHIHPDPTRTRKLLMHRHELDGLVGDVVRKGYTLVPLSLYWSKGKAKLGIGLAKGKKQHDKRATQKDRDWERQKSRVLKGVNK
jgi:SsrA-binding protein